MGTAEGRIPTQETSPSKSVKLFQLTNLRLPALPNLYEKSITSGNSAAVLPETTEQTLEPKDYDAVEHKLIIANTSAKI